MRIFNTYGPYELAGKYRNVIPNFIEKALNGEDLVITGTGKETRDFTYVDDLIDLMLSAALSPGQPLYVLLFGVAIVFFAFLIYFVFK